MNIIYWLAVDLSQLGVLFPIYGENNIPLVSQILLIYGLYIYMVIIWLMMVEIYIYIL
jgi:hypothetical protein